MIKIISNSKSWLLKNLPFRDEDNCDRNYNNLLIVPTGKKHNSGFMKIAIIGVVRHNGRLGESARYWEEAEICAYPDDILWHIPPGEDVGSSMLYNLRTDCFYPSGTLRVWLYGYEFRVSFPLSSTDIYVIKQSPQPSPDTDTQPSAK